MSRASDTWVGIRCQDAPARPSTHQPGRAEHAADEHAVRSVPPRPRVATVPSGGPPEEAGNHRRRAPLLQQRGQHPCVPRRRVAARSGRRAVVGRRSTPRPSASHLHGRASGRRNRRATIDAATPSPRDTRTGRLVARERMGRGRPPHGRFSRYSLRRADRPRSGGGGGPGRPGRHQVEDERAVAAQEGPAWALAAATSLRRRSDGAPPRERVGDRPGGRETTTTRGPVCRWMSSPPRGATSGGVGARRAPSLPHLEGRPGVLASRRPAAHAARPALRATAPAPKPPSHAGSRTLRKSARRPSNDGGEGWRALEGLDGLHPWPLICSTTAPSANAPSLRQPARRATTSPPAVSREQPSVSARRRFPPAPRGRSGSSAPAAGAADGGEGVWRRRPGRRGPGCGTMVDGFHRRIGLGEPGLARPGDGGAAGRPGRSWRQDRPIVDEAEDSTELAGRRWSILRDQACPRRHPGARRRGRAGDQPRSTGISKAHRLGTLRRSTRAGSRARCPTVRLGDLGAEAG
jgi:hypothetical protein